METALKTAEHGVQPEDTACRQLVTFRIGAETFGIRMDAVKEIIRVPEMVSAPLTSQALVGVANLRGNMLPVLDMRTLFGMESRAYDEATRIIVTGVTGETGLVVDRVLRVIEVDYECPDVPQDEPTKVDAEFILGIVQNPDGKGLIQVLDVSALLQMESVEVGNSNTELSVSGVTKKKAVDEPEEENGTQIITCILEDQEFAFFLDDVDEIVRPPEKITHVPGSQDAVLGAVHLRGRVLGLVGMRELFEFERRERDESQRVIVLRKRLPGGRPVRVGVLVDEVRSVLTVSEDEKDPIPSAIRQSAESAELSELYKLDGGRRVVTVVSVETLFQKPEVQDAIHLARDELAETNMIDGGNAMHDETMAEFEVEEDVVQLVVFNLEAQEYAVSIDSVQEITRLPDELERVPKTPDFIEGVINLRGIVLPVVDMRKRFDLAAMERNDRQRIIVMNIGGNRTGFIVDLVSEVLRLPGSAIEDAPVLSSEQGRVMGKVINLVEQKRLIHVLDPSQLLSAEEKIVLNKED